MPLSAIQNLQVVKQADGTYLASWTADAGADLYVILRNGQPLTTVAWSPVVLPAAIVPGDVITVTAEALSPSDPYTIPVPTPTLKGLIIGPVWRGAPVASWWPYFGGMDICGTEQGAVGADQIFAVGGKIIPGNPIEVALATGHPCNARVEFGIHTPSDMMNADGKAFTMHDPTTGKSALCPIWWKVGGNYQAERRARLTALAAAYEGVSNFQKLIFSPETFYSEADIRQGSDPTSVLALTTAGYSDSEDMEVRMADYTFLPTIFPTTRLGQAFNARQIIAGGRMTISTADTSLLVKTFATTVGKQASVENNSVRYPQIQYPVLYTQDMPVARSLGATVAIQLAADTQVGNEVQAAAYATGALKAVAVEMTGEVTQKVTQPQLETIMAACKANAA